jgi:hypothetical protein
MSLDVYSHAQQAVDAATLEQCDALQAALYARADRDWPGWDKGLAPRTATNIIGAIHGKPPIPARRKVGLLEAIVRRVECCDPKVTRTWRKFRRAIAVALVIVGVVAILEPWQRAAGIAVACCISLGLWFSMSRGKASVCH